MFLFRLTLICAVLTAFALVITSCGSSWTIEGNNMTIIKVETDSIAPAGSYLILPDENPTQSHVSTPEK